MKWQEILKFGGTAILDETKELLEGWQPTNEEGELYKGELFELVEKWDNNKSYGLLMDLKNLRMSWQPKTEEGKKYSKELGDLVHYWELPPQARKFYR
jgi:hypothetical protein